MKILNCCMSDWANLSHNNAIALRSVGIDCEDVKQNHHTFNYDSESNLLNINAIKSKIENADLVQIFHTDVTMLHLCKEVGHNNIFVWHTGTNYRQESQRMNDEFNPYVKKSFMDEGEFYNLGAINPIYIAAAIDTNKIKPIERKIDYSIGHYPSNSKVKGSDNIDYVVDLLKFAYDSIIDYTTNRAIVKHSSQLKRMQECDIYVELFAPEQNGFNYGHFGVTAMEAAALGKIVVTCHCSEDVYKNEYGVNTPFYVITGEKGLYKILESLIKKTPEEIKTIQNETREWLVKYHSIEATGLRMKKHING